MAIRAAWSLATLLGLASPALAQDCRLALVLALDVSSSVDADEDRLQREGLAHALTAPEVVRVFLAGDPVALYVFQWSGAAWQVPMLPGWVVVDSTEDLTWVARVIAETERIGSRRHTALGAALTHASEAFASGPMCQARTVDIASDGRSNDGVQPYEVYRSHSLDGVTVNALVVGEASDIEGQHPGTTRRLVAWFQAEILHGPSAFWILADGYEDYEGAMRIKLARELQAPLMSGLPAAGGGT